MVSKYYLQYKLKLKNSVADEPYPKQLDNSYIESLIYGLWKINLINLVKLKAVLAKEFHIQPSELERMPFWEYELFIKTLNERVKEENKQQEAEMNKYDINHMQSQMKNAQNFKSPSSFKMPNMNMPKF